MQNKLEIISNFFEDKEIRSILKAKDKKMQNVNMLDTKEILRLIESLPSPKAEPYKLWLANLGSERISEVFDPEIAVKRAISYYRSRGYTYEWIKAKMVEILHENKLTNT